MAGFWFHLLVSSHLVNKTSWSFIFTSWPCQDESCICSLEKYWRNPAACRCSIVTKSLNTFVAFILFRQSGSRLSSLKIFLDLGFSYTADLKTKPLIINIVFHSRTGNCRSFIFYVYFHFTSSEYPQALKNWQHLNSGVSFQGSLSTRSINLPTVCYLLIWV